MSTPPVSGLAVPRPGPGVAHAPVSVSQSFAIVRAVCAPVFDARTRLQPRTDHNAVQYTSTDDHMRRFGHHIDQRAAVLGVVKTRATLCLLRLHV